MNIADDRYPSRMFPAAPQGWQMVQRIQCGDGKTVYRVHNSETGTAIVFTLTRFDTSITASQRTASFNIDFCLEGALHVSTEITGVIEYYFRLFETTDPRSQKHALHKFDPDIAAHCSMLSAPCFASLEKAFFISDPYDLKFFTIHPFDRIYFGNEYCHRLMPDASQIAAVAEFAQRFGAPLTLVTPICPEGTVEPIAQLLGLLAPRSEVVFNDYGMAAPIIEAGHIPIHGRLLCHNKRDPRVMSSGGRFASYHKMHNLQPRLMRHLLDAGITRIEADGSPPGLDITLCEGMRASFHAPYYYSATTRKCAFAAQGTKKFFVAARCNYQCGQSQGAQTYSLGKTTMLADGNTHFFYDTHPARSLAASGADRLVYSPVTPNHNRFAPPDECIMMDWSRVYSFGDIPAMWGAVREDRLARILANLRLPSVTTVLDIGCGAARNSDIFPPDRFLYHGIDISDRAVEKATEDFPHGRFATIDFSDDSAEFPASFPDRFDMLIDIGCFHTLPPHKQAAYFHRTHALLDRDGLMILAAWHSLRPFTPVCYVMDQIPEWGVSRADVERLTNGLFSIESSETRTGSFYDFRFWMLRRQ